MRTHRVAAIVALVFAPFGAIVAQERSAVQQSAREILRQLIGINTDGDSGSTTLAAQAIATRLIGAGFPSADVKIVGPASNPKNWNLEIGRAHV